MKYLGHVKSAVKRKGSLGGATIFFRLMLSHNSLVNYYKTVFALVQNHKWSLTEIENMVVYEREVYVALLIEFIEEENQRMEEERQKYG